MSAVVSSKRKRSGLEPQRPAKHARDIDSTLKELDEVFGYLEAARKLEIDRESFEKKKPATLHLPEPIPLQWLESHSDPEFQEKLKIFLAADEPFSVSGEPTMLLKFTPRYHTLSVSSKIRLLRLTQREEIATEILTTHFQTMGDYHRLELLQVSPIKQLALATEIWKTFGSISSHYRAWFINTAPIEFISSVVLKNTSCLSVAEALTACKLVTTPHLLHEVCVALWERNTEFIFPADFVAFSELLSKTKLEFPVVKAMAKEAEKIRGACLDRIEELQVEAESVENNYGYLSEVNVLVTDEDGTSIQEMEKIGVDTYVWNVMAAEPMDSFCVVLGTKLGAGRCGKMTLYDESMDEESVIGVIRDGEVMVRGRPSGSFRVEITVSDEQLHVKDGTIVVLWTGGTLGCIKLDVSSQDSVADLIGRARFSLGLPTELKLSLRDLECRKLTQESILLRPQDSFNRVLILTKD